MILISNGFNKFHLPPAASELAKRGLLCAFSTGAYPKMGMRKCLEALGLAKIRRVARLIGRVEPIPENLVFADWMSEALHVARSVPRRWGLTRAASDWANEQSMKWYGRRAQKVVRYAIRNGAKLYHYRAGFGHASVRLAKRHGLFTLCDHSIAHPAMLEQLLAEGGRWPTAASRSRPQTRVWQDIQQDIEQADAVLLNSNFVKETFLRQGWEPSRLHVVYTGVDDAFLLWASRTQVHRFGKEEALRAVFAGCFEERKGARTLTAAMQQLLLTQDRRLELHIAGSVGQDAQEQFRALRRHPTVHYHGLLLREELASLLASADIFVFPSLAEGSARVVFEALACGCYIITTPNSGSIVEDGVHGRLVPAGDPEALVASLREAISLGREALRDVGARNARIVREQYRQSQYGAKLVALYSQILGLDMNE